MKWNLTGKCFFMTGTLIVALACGAGLASGWGGSTSTSRSSSGSTSSWGGSGSSWGGSGSTQTPTCSPSGITLSLTMADCLKCHPGVDAAQVTRHHLLIGVPPKNLSCLSCHQPAQDGSSNISFPVIRDCIVCHKSSVHDAVIHCVVDTCGGCHPESLPKIHAGGGSRSGSWSSYHSGGSYGGSSSNSGVSACYLCHTSTNNAVQQTIAKGLAGQTVSCSDCHGGGR